MTQLNPDAFITQSEYEVGVINNLHISLQVWSSSGSRRSEYDDRWVVQITGEGGSQSHFEVDDETAGLVMRCGSVIEP